MESCSPIFASALQFAFDKATTEGKVTIVALVVVSIFSWTVMITKGRQLFRAHRASKRFFACYRRLRDPLELFSRKEAFAGSPGFEVYTTGCEELAYQLKNHAMPVEVQSQTGKVSGAATSEGEQVELFANRRVPKISPASFDSVKVALEREVGAQALALEKGMIVLSTAVAGGPFIGLLGTVWGVMETFSGIAKVQAASLTAMAPGVAGALIATVVGLFVAIPAMFAYNYMITLIRALTQELDNFVAELCTAIEHAYVDSRSVSEEVADALRRIFPERPAGSPERKQPVPAGAVLARPELVASSA